MKAKAGRRTDKPKCGLCGKTRALTRTECCGQWICDDEDKYVLFSYARNSCSRNHRRFTLCGHHHTEGHAGSWKECSPCGRGFETEMYVWYGTNEYNVERLQNPPTYEPTKCSVCGAVIVLSQGGYSMRGAEHWCEACTAKEMKDAFRRAAAPGPPGAARRARREPYAITGHPPQRVPGVGRIGGGPPGDRAPRTEEGRET